MNTTTLPGAISGTLPGTLPGTLAVPAALRTLPDVTANPPVRRHGGLEVPASGLWPLMTSSHLSHIGDRGRREQLHVRGGWLDLADDPDDCWIHIEMDGRFLDLTDLRIADDSYGNSAWHLTGVSEQGVSEQGGARLPMTMTLRYHGMFRHGDQQLAWFSGTANIEPANASRRRSARSRVERLHVDLLFESQ